MKRSCSGTSQVHAQRASGKISSVSSLKLAIMSTFLSLPRALSLFSLYCFLWNNVLLCPAGYDRSGQSEQSVGLTSQRAHYLLTLAPQAPLRGNDVSVSTDLLTSCCAVATHTSFYLSPSDSSDKLYWIQ